MMPTSLRKPTAPAACTRRKALSTCVTTGYDEVRNLRRGLPVGHGRGARTRMACPVRLSQELFLPPDLIPSDTKEMESRLGALAAYGTDIFIVGGGQSIPLCRRGSGFDAAGLDYLIGKRTQYYARRQRDRTLMKGDRVAVLGRGIAVVEQVDDTEVHAAAVEQDHAQDWAQGNCLGRAEHAVGGGSLGSLEILLPKT